MKLSHVFYLTMMFIALYRLVCIIRVHIAIMLLRHIFTAVSTVLLFALAILILMYFTIGYH